MKLKDYSLLPIYDNFDISLTPGTNIDIKMYYHYNIDWHNMQTMRNFINQRKNLRRLFLLLAAAALTSRSACLLLLLLPLVFQPLKARPLLSSSFPAVPVRIFPNSTHSSTLLWGISEKTLKIIVKNVTAVLVLSISQYVAVPIHVSVLHCNSTRTLLTLTTKKY